MKDHMTNTPGQALLAPSDIAKLGDVSAAAVSNWRKRSTDFPQPAGGSGTRPLFARDDVLAWMKANNKPIVGLATSNAIAAMNLVHEIRLPFASSLDDAASLIVSLLAAKKLSEQDPSALPLWQGFLGRAATNGIAALRELGANYEIDRWNDLVELPEFAEEIAPSAVDKIARLIDDIPGEEVAAAADAVLARAVGAMGRAGSEHGYVGSRVSEFLAHISAPDAHGVVYDPACGIGDVLTQLIEMDAAGQRRIRWMVAHDINEQAVILADQRGFFRDGPVELSTVDVLAKDPAPELKADLIVAEPPYGMHYDGYDLLDPRWAYGTPAKSSSELAWIQHAIAHLADEGVAYVVTPGGPLFRGGRDGEIRRRLIADGCVHAIYQLPPKLLQHTSIPVAVWVLGQPGTAQTIRFVNAQSYSILRGGRVELHPFSGRAEFEAANPSADVSTADVLAGDANLVPERWIGLDTPDPSAVVGAYGDAVARIHETGRSTGSADVREFRATSPARVVTIRDLEGHGALEVRTGRPGPGRGEDNDPRRVSGSDIVRGKVGEGQTLSDSPRAGEVTAPGDVLVATVGQLAVALDEFGGHILGTGVVGLRVTGQQLRPDYLTAVINGKWNRRFFTGQTIQRVAVRDLEVPILTMPDQEAFAQAAADLRNIRRAAKQLETAAGEALESLAEVARFGTDLDANDA
jgi:hypothetical protein